MYGNAGMTAAQAQRLSAAVQAALKEPAFAQRMTALGLEPIGSTPEQLATVQKADLAKWAKPVKASGFQAD
jgi:tripartite-type tricarboxylate transporter receptor subunit TctC